MIDTVLQWFQQWLPFLQQTGDVLSSAGHSAGDVAGQALGKMDMAGLLALAGALGWASGFRLYAVVFLTGLMGLLGWVPLPHSMQLLEHPAVLGASGFMLFMEFFADKIPGLDSLWDLANSVIRIPAGAALAGSVFGADGGTMTLVATILGGTLAATSQAAKTSTRAAINTSPEPFSNVAASLFEDGLVVGILWLAVNEPLVFGVVLLVAVVLMVLVTILLVRFLRAAIRRLKTWFGAEPAPSP
ncbi:DUF4126 domain-containing protein [Brachymonas denitrificans]|uniref:DUF4126 domain-containing protein n=1 Tax=Brachymonas denitrificans TaxID=28220 RepID=UPI00396A1700